MTYLIVAAAVLAAGALGALVLGCLSYRLSRHEVEVLLFGFRIRRVMLNDIQDVAEGGSLLAEHWPNTLLGGGRSLTLHRRSGLFRRFVITPRDRSHFRKQIEFALGWKMGGGRKGEEAAPASSVAAS